MDMLPEGVEQLLDVGQKCSFFFFLSFDIWCSKPFCTTVVWSMMIEAFDAMIFWKVCIRESEIDGDRTNDSIANFTPL